MRASRRVLAATAVVVAGIITTPLDAGAQTAGAIAFELPLNLTQLPFHISKIRVSCHARDGYGRRSNIGAQEVPVVAGRVTTTAVIEVTIAPQSAGDRLTYECDLNAFSVIGNEWVSLTSAQDPKLLVLSPQPAKISGTITW
jgi:hypothetical protein